jgi:RNA polymerase sigma-70 factor (ECF subfamily)
LKHPPRSDVNKGKPAPDGGDGRAVVSELVRRFRAGDESAFDELVKRLTPRLNALALRSLGSAEAAEEAVQDAWVRIYNRIGDVQDPQAFEGWAIRVTLSRINDEFRARSRERSAREGLAELRREDLARVLREALESLDDTHREVFVLREVEGLPHAEIAKMLGIPEGTVWSRLSYARRMLRDYLKRRRDDVT